MSDFTPGVEAARKALGSSTKIDAKPHAAGGKGVKFSLDEVARRVRDGRNDPRVRGWATQAIHAAGGPQDNVGKASAILAALKKKTTYVLDPVGTEFMAQPHQTLCLDEHGLCIPGADCDDLTIAYASATLSVGIPSMVVGQGFDNSGVPSHVIAAILNNNSDSEWLRVDPSTNKPVGDYVTAKKEWWVDPLNPDDKTSTTIAGAGDFVGVGVIPVDRQGSTGVGASSATPASSSVAETVVQQVQSVLYDLQTAAASLSASLSQVEQVKTTLGYDPEPAGITITGLSDFPSTGVWTSSMDTVAKGILSTAQYLIGVCQQALDGARDLYVDATSSDIGIAAQSTDPYVWKVLSTGAEAIIGVFSPAGALLTGIVEATGEVLTPTAVQAQVGTTTEPAGVDGVPSQGVGEAPIVLIAAGAVVIVASITACIMYVKWCEQAKAYADQAAYQGYVAVAQKLFPNNPSAQASYIAQQRQLDIDAANAAAKNNPFGSALDGLTGLLAAGVAAGALVLAWPLLKELGESAASALHAKRLAGNKVTT